MEVDPSGLVHALLAEVHEEAGGSIPTLEHDPYEPETYGSGSSLIPRLGPDP